MEVARTTDCVNVARVTSHGRSVTKRTFLTAVVVLGYALVLPYVYNTTGEPLARAIAEAEKLDALKPHVTPSSATDTPAEAVVSWDETSGSNIRTEEEGIEDDFGFDAELDVSHAAHKEKSEDEDFESEFDATVDSEVKPPATDDDLGVSNSSSSSSNGTDTDEDEEEEARPLPGAWLPDAGAAAALFALLSVHALFHLLCRWSVNFRASVLFSTSTRVAASGFLLVEPHPHRGRAEMVEVVRSKVSKHLEMEFQRQRFEILAPGETLGDTWTLAVHTEGTEELGSQVAESARAEAEKVMQRGGVIRPVRSRTDGPVRDYLVGKGMSTEADVVATLDRFGPNSVALVPKSFKDILKEQLLSPLSIFQLFSAGLWLLDEYWQYTIFTLISIVMMEATTSFQRFRTLKTLKGLSPEPYELPVFRCGKWVTLSTKDLLPGDVISLNTSLAADAAAATAITASDGDDDETDAEKAKKATATKAKSALTMAREIVPCDCLILRGRAVVNEATMTGESVPQMKDALTIGDAATGDGTVRSLDMHASHRVHVLFSGTALISTTAGGKEASGNSSDIDSEATVDSIPTPPDNGCVCRVLRTGFSSSQGELMQMIEFSTEDVSADSKETGLALLILLCFALVSAGYVFKRGMEKGDRTTHELMLKCVMIITSVVPRQLPVQMAMAVNHALLALNREGIFCTEPYRVPYSGKITHCLFDKTGTLTTDELVPVGVVNKQEDRSASTGSVVQPLVKVAEACSDAAMVLAACHSLVSMPKTAAEIKAEEAAAAAAPPGQRVVPRGSLTGRLLGDPIEMEALKGVEWRFNPDTQTCTPGDWAIKEVALAKVKEQLQAARSAGGATAVGAIEGRRDKRSRDVAPAVTGGSGAPGSSKHVKELEAQVSRMENRLSEAKSKAARSPMASIQIVHRYHFSSKLQRMSVLCKAMPRVCSDTGGGVRTPEYFVLVKGSPEALEPLLTPSSVPSWYNSTYRHMAERGMRILALAVRPCTEAEALNGTLSRDVAERGLRFSGFVAFECKTRSDSPMVVQSLREADHRVAMLTGDAPLTALHVARITGICTPLSKEEMAHHNAASAKSKIKSDDTKNMEKKKGEEEEEKKKDDGVLESQAWAKKEGVPLLLAIVCEDADNEAVEWQSAVGATAGSLRIPFMADASDCDLGTLSVKHDLLVTENAMLVAARVSHGNFWRGAEFVQVFARMSPQGKARVIRAIQTSSEGHSGNTDGNFVLMCGDGGNDVGALKQSDVGLALLSGYGSANTEERSAEDKKDGAATTITGSGGAETALNSKRVEMQKKQKVMLKLRNQEFAQVKKAIVAKQQGRVSERIEKLKAEGKDAGVMAHMSMTKEVMKETQAEVRAAASALDKKYNMHLNKATGAKSAEEALEASLEALDDPNALPVVRPGDASVAAPFTSRTPSVASVVQLIRQGRCTLLSAMQQQQIMMLECTISAYCLAALSLEGARSSERQMMASGWLVMTASVAFSFSTPVERMHPVRPTRSLFHPSVALSVLGQALIHLGCMLFAVNLATSEMGETKLREVVVFNRKAARGLLTANETASVTDEIDAMQEMMMLWRQPFMPNLMNTVVFLIETSQIMAVLFVNYKGRPWMKGLTENHALFLSLFTCIGGIAVAAWEVNPQMNRLLHLEPFPNEEFKWTVMGLVFASLVGTFMWDRLMTAIFAPRVFKAMMEEAAKTTFDDVLPIFMTLGKVIGGGAVVFSGNPIIWFGAFWMYRKYKQRKEAELMASVQL